MIALSGIKTTESGLLLGFQYHDGVVSSLIFDASSSRLTVNVKALSGSVLTVHTEDVKKCRIDNLLEGNIVSDIYLWKIDSDTSSITSDALPAWRVLLSDMNGSESFHQEAMRNAKKYDGFMALLIRDVLRMRNCCYLWCSTYIRKTTLGLVIAPRERYSAKSTALYLATERPARQPALRRRLHAG